VLAIDDVDKTVWRIDSLYALFHLIHKRHEAKLHTIITANITPGRMRDVWGQVEGDQIIVTPMYDRMRDFQRVVLQGESLRGLS